jgi:hypothetical protein
MLCRLCGIHIKLPDGTLDPFARWGDLCDECLDNDLAQAILEQELREQRKLDQQLRVRPAHVREERKTHGND